jgi:hypothetical protein
LDKRLVDPRAYLDDTEKRKFFTLLELELRPLGRAASSSVSIPTELPRFTKLRKFE